RSTLVNELSDLRKPLVTDFAPEVTADLTGIGNAIQGTAHSAHGMSVSLDNAVKAAKVAGDTAVSETWEALSAAPALNPAGMSGLFGKDSPAMKGNFEGTGGWWGNIAEEAAREPARRMVLDLPTSQFEDSVDKAQSAVTSLDWVGKSNDITSYTPDMPAHEKP